MNYTLYQVDAFAKKVFDGNPAAVIISENPPNEREMLQIAIENNLSETAYAKPTDSNTYDLRWFTPGGEVDLIGTAITYLRGQITI